MPIFMDRHDIPGVSAKGVAEAHQEDLKIQHKYDFKGLTYWFDEDKGMAFCLIEAPDKDCVKRLHDDAHGLIPHQIIEVEPDVVESFLGRIEDPEKPSKGNTQDYVVINDPAFRALMVVEWDGNPVINSDSSALGFEKCLNTFKEIYSTKLKKHNGREVEYLDTGLLASFDSVSQSVLCALAIQNAIQEIKEKEKIFARIGLSAGNPVTSADNLFESTVKCARRLCALSSPGKVMTDSVINELYNSKIFNSNPKDNNLIFLTPNEEEFINTMMEILEINWNNPLFGIENFCQKLGMSKSKLYRKINFITGYSPSEIIKEFRLKEAKKAIEKQDRNISDVAYECGFSSLSYFTKCFLKRFGMPPSRFANVL